jgi:hypothetical protein
VRGLRRAPGWSPRPAGLSVDVPAGIDDGQRIRVTGRGHDGERGGPAGDLYVLVRVREDQRFIRDGDDLVTVVDVLARTPRSGRRPGADARRPARARHPRRARSPGTTIAIRGAGMPPLRRGRRGDLRVVVNVVIPRKLSREQKRLLEQLADSFTATWTTGARACSPSSSASSPVIRLAVTVRGDDAGRGARGALALSPGGVEERDLPDGVEYAIYGPPGELPALPDVEAAAGDVLVSVTREEVADDWDERWKAWHSPSRSAGALRIRPAVGAGARPGDSSSSSTRARRSAPAPTRRRACASSSCCHPASGRSPTGAAGPGVLAIAAAKLGFDPVSRVDSDPLAVEATAANAQVNGVDARQVGRVNLRERPARPRPTVCANLLRPLLLDVARALERPPERLIVSGLLREEADEVARAFAAQGLEEVERRHCEEWSALLLGRVPRLGSRHALERRHRRRRLRRPAGRPRASSATCRRSREGHARLDVNFMLYTPLLPGSRGRDARAAPRRRARCARSSSARTSGSAA